jgi:hypothetical protein
LGLACAGAVDDHRDDVAPCGKSHDADSPGVDAPLLGATPDQPHCAEAVFAGVNLRLVGRALLTTEPVLENKSGHAQTVEKAGRFDPFRIIDQLAMPPPGQTTTAAPVALSLGGRNAVTEGL